MKFLFQLIALRAREFDILNCKSSVKCLDLHPFLSPDGGIGRRAGLKHQCWQQHVGSTPTPGTSRSTLQRDAAFFISEHSQTTNHSSIQRFRTGLTNCFRNEIKVQE